MIFTPDLSQSELVAKYAKWPSQFIEVNGLKIHYRDTGERTAEPLVLLHGFGSSLQTWDDWSKVLEQSHRVVRLDLAGFGLTGQAPGHDYSDQADVQRIVDFLNALGIERCILIGHSMGGRIAWNFASQYPNRVRALILMAPDGFPLPGQRVGERPYDVGSIADLIKFVMPKFLVRKSLEPAFFDARSVSEELLDRYYDLLRAPTVRESILQRMRQTVNSDPQERLKRITTPTLLLWGERDRMIPSSNSLDYERALPNSKTVILPKASHLLQEENPEVGLKSVLNFINTQPR
jgi:pimeloyl-ACP methyl ester carboxylesterase